MPRTSDAGDAATCTAIWIYPGDTETRLMATTSRRMVIHRAGQSGGSGVVVSLARYQNYVSTGDVETKFKEAKTNRSVVDGMSNLLVPRAHSLGRTCTVRPPAVSVSCARFSFPSCTNERTNEERHLVNHVSNTLHVGTRSWFSRSQVKLRCGYDDLSFAPFFSYEIFLIVSCFLFLGVFWMRRDFFFFFFLEIEEGFLWVSHYIIRYWFRNTWKILYPSNVLSDS